MTVGKVKDFNFKTPACNYSTGGAVKAAVHKHEKAMHPGKPLTRLAKGGAVAGKAELIKAMEKSYPKGAVITPTKPRKSVPVAPREPMVKLKKGGAPSCDC